MDERLEQISKHQVNIINDLHCYVMDQCLGQPRAAGDLETLNRRMQQGSEYLSSIGVNLDNGWPIITVEKAAKSWYEEEMQWSQKEWSDRLPEAWLYRILTAFSRNHVTTPFVKNHKPLMGNQVTVSDSQEFVKINSQIFNEFCMAMIKPEERMKETELCALRAHLLDLSSHNLDNAICSARHELMGKNCAILQGVVIGIGTGVLISIFLGPAIGAAIGKLVGGYAGAAATSYGLALLGGGSIASGGFGMLGGSIVLGVGFGGVKGTLDGLTAANIDMLNLHIAFRNLPILLATGKKLKELGYNAIPKQLRECIHDRRQENRERLRTLDPDNGDCNERKSMIETTDKIYEKAFNMALKYDWK